MTQKFKLYDKNHTFLCDLSDDFSSLDKDKVKNTFDTLFQTILIDNHNDHRDKYFAIGNGGDMVIYNKENNEIEYYSDSG